MTSRSSDRCGPLARRRLALAATYQKARRRHRGAGKAAAELRATTAALLREELRRARRQAAQAPQTDAATLFEINGK